MFFGVGIGSCWIEVDWTGLSGLDCVAVLSYIWGGRAIRVSLFAWKVNYRVRPSHPSPPSKSRRCAGITARLACLTPHVTLSLSSRPHLPVLAYLWSMRAGGTSRRVMGERDGRLNIKQVRD